MGVAEAPYTRTDESLAPRKRVSAVPSRKGPAYWSKAPQFSLPELSTGRALYGWWSETWLSSAACTYRARNFRSLSPPLQLPSPWPIQGPFQAMPKAVRSVDVEGTAKSHTVSSTGTSCWTPPVIRNVPVYFPAGVLSGTWMSTNTTRLSLAGTSKGNALRFSPAIGSTSGISASGQVPAAPSPPLGQATLISASR